MNIVFGLPACFPNTASVFFFFFVILCWENGSATSAAALSFASRAYCEFDQSVSLVSGQKTVFEGNRQTVNVP